jgi:hypothetical protein
MKWFRDWAIVEECFPTDRKELKSTDKSATETVNGGHAKRKQQYNIGNFNIKKEIRAKDT